MNELFILCYMVGALLGLFLFIFPFVMLAKINAKLGKILTSLEATQYIAEKHDFRSEEKAQ